MSLVFILEGFSWVLELENNPLSCSLSTAIIIFLEHFNALFKMVLLTICPKNGKKFSSGPWTNRETITAREKHYTLVWYMLTMDIYFLLSNQSARKVLFTCLAMANFARSDWSISGPITYGTDPDGPVAFAFFRFCFKRNGQSLWFWQRKPWAWDKAVLRLEKETEKQKELHYTKNWLWKLSTTTNPEPISSNISVLF